eukprot:SAG11_NODE_16496_length_545_cov_10.849776_2_plen_117_part_01
MCPRVRCRVKVNTFHPRFHKRYCFTAAHISGESETPIHTPSSFVDTSSAYLVIVRDAIGSTSLSVTGRGRIFAPKVEAFAGKVAKGAGVVSNMAAMGALATAEVPIVGEVLGGVSGV